ncbi:MAG TPA: 1-deoxy-D-xylulose-5-phosphate reductoisomerase [Clostridia bacterium]|nr:1-deoxy-D-xylulose-5-phosphate reductoisomerase [Clostridia bacterium]
MPDSLHTPLPSTKVLAILGSTGSIGRQSLQVAQEEGYRVAALAAGKNSGELARQIQLFQPAFVSVQDQETKDQLVRILTDQLPAGFVMPIIDFGRQALLEVARWQEADTVIAAITGFAGLEPVLAAASSGKKIALANKESLVVAGHEIKRQAALSGAWILPVDSEHSAIWQCMLAALPGSVRRLILTCSGGPFQDKTLEDLAQVTPAQALDHPTWSMGGKITIDSASLMNKAFEVIEACHLFDMDPALIDVAVHRQSLVHSLVEFKDGSLMAQLGDPDMTLPIRFALTFPHRSDRGEVPPFDLLSQKRWQWTFEAVDDQRFPSIGLARQALAAGGLMPLVLNAANEAAVASFMAGRLPFRGIFELIEGALDHFSPLSAIKESSFDDMMGQHQRVIEFVDRQTAF